MEMASELFWAFVCVVGNRGVSTSHCQASSCQWKKLGEAGQPLHHPPQWPWHRNADQDPAPCGEVAGSDRRLQHCPATTGGGCQGGAYVRKDWSGEVDDIFPQPLLVSILGYSLYVCCDVLVGGCLQVCVQFNTCWNESYLFCFVLLLVLFFGGVRVRTVGEG